MTSTKEDPDFTAFWAVYPRKARKIEARYEWRGAVTRFGADPIILAAARFRAETASQPVPELPLAAVWLRTLEELEADQPDQPAQPGIFGLDLTRLGDVLLTTCVISRQLGHMRAMGTVRDYLAPHGPHDAETTFVYDMLLGRSPQEMISIEEVTEWMSRIKLPPV